MSFANKRVLVTGGSRGIGFGVVTAFLEAGARVALNGRSDASVSAAMDKLDGASPLVAAVGDVATVEGCQAAVGSAVDAMGGLDILVNSAGVGHFREIEACDEALWDETLDINLKDTFFCCRAAVPALRASKGNIINLASDAGLMGTAGLSVYCASKGGVVNLTKALALELAPTIRVNCVCPGFVDTDMVRRDHIDLAQDPAASEQELVDFAPLQRIATPSEISQSVLYLAGANNVTGAALQIDGGTTAGR